MDDSEAIRFYVQGLPQEHSRRFECWGLPGKRFILLKLHPFTKWTASGRPEEYIPVEYRLFERGTNWKDGKWITVAQGRVSKFKQWDMDKALQYAEEMGKLPKVIV